jgi:hypothetical protein
MIGGRVPPTIGSGAPGLGGAAGALRPPPPGSSCAATIGDMKIAADATATASAKHTVTRFIVTPGESILAT